LTRDALLAFVMTMASALSVWTALFVAIPAAARARFKLKLTELRDRCDDEFLIFGALVDEPSINDFWERANNLIGAAERFTIADALAVHRSFEQAGLRPPRRTHTYKQLPTDVQERMAGYEMELLTICRRYLLTGSVSGWMLGTLSMAGKTRTRLRRRFLPRNAPNTAQLVQDYSRAIEIEPEMKRCPVPVPA